MYDIVLTTDNMAAKNWPCNPSCSLCFCLPETTPHLLTQCNFTEATWNIVASHLSLPQYSAMASVGDLGNGCSIFIAGNQNREKKESGHFVLFFVANLKRV
jgi:hypothetical protein